MYKKNKSRCLVARPRARAMRASPFTLFYGFTVLMAYELVLNSNENPISKKTQLCKYMTCIIMKHNVECNKKYYTQLVEI